MRVTAETAPLRVLIADDHLPTREDVREALENDARFTVCAAVADAPEAVRAALRERPDVCLIDVRMPGSGLAAAWEIAARLPQTKIVILTISDGGNDLFAALRAGAVGYLLKTMNLERLPAALHGVYYGEAAMPRAPDRPGTGAVPRPGAAPPAAGRSRAHRRTADQPGVGSARIAGAGALNRGDRGETGAVGQRGARTHRCCCAETPGDRPRGGRPAVPQAPGRINPQAPGPKASRTAARGQGRAGGRWSA